jgi:Cu/Ag efflux protein CusF
MRRLFTPAAAIVLAAAFAASAPAATVTGTIATVDIKNDSITLVDGRHFTLPEGIEAEKLKSGEKVTVTYAVKNGKMVVSKIRASK